jgi:hypothetical protein
MRVSLCNVVRVFPQSLGTVLVILSSNLLTGITQGFRVSTTDFQPKPFCVQALLSGIEAADGCWVPA